MQRSDVPEAINQEFTKSKWVLTPPSTQTPIPFEHFADVHNFVDQEVGFWSTQESPTAQRVHRHWQQVQTDLNNCLQAIQRGQDYRQFLGQAFSRITNRSWPNVTKESALAQKVLSWGDNISENRRTAFLFASFDGQSRPNNFNLEQPETFTGFLEGLAFRNPEILSAYLKVADENLRKNYDDRVQETEELRKKYTILESQLQDDFSQKKSELDNWRTEKIKALDGEYSEMKTRFSNLENLYTEKLKLEAPAKYWQKRASRMRWAGFAWLLVSVFFFSGIGAILWFLFVAPGTFVDPKDLLAQTANITANKDSFLAYLSSAKNIRSLIGFSVLVSLYFFVLRMLIRLTVSSFHLSIDAAEREQLTYVYLALVERGQKSGEKLIQDNERSIILQSLFSRADTGLLTGDSSPTMPGTDVVAAIKGNKSP